MTACSAWVHVCYSVCGLSQPAIDPAADAYCASGTTAADCAVLCCAVLVSVRPCRYLLQLDSGGNVAASGGQLRLDAPATPPQAPPASSGGGAATAGERYTPHCSMKYRTAQLPASSSRVAAGASVGGTRCARKLRDATATWLCAAVPRTLWGAAVSRRA
jgi:hypothetical protein